MPRRKVLFKKETEIWIHADNESLCGNLCEHLIIRRAGFGFAICNLFNNDRHGYYIGANLMGFHRCEGCFNLEII